MSKLFFLIFCSLEPVVMHFFYFPSTEVVSITALLIFMLGLFVFGLLLMTGKKTLTVVFVAEALVFVLLDVWHANFSSPLSLAVVAAQYKEGLVFAGRVLSVFLQPAVFLTLFVLAAKLFYLYKFFTPFEFNAKVFAALAVPLVALLGLTYKTFHKSYFNQMDFNAYAKTLGYFQAWTYEVITAADRSLLFDDIMANINQPAPPLPAEFKNISLPENIFVIQIESLNYSALTEVVDGKPVMPFLRSIADKSYVYKIEKEAPSCSANADFSVLTGYKDRESLYAAVYNMIPLEYYKNMITLPEKYRRAGYRTAFYHGFVERYYDRKKNVSQMSFDNIWFQENLPITAPLGAMGFDDKDLFEFVLQQNQQHAKNFNFIITVSSHDPFSIGEIYKYPYASPQNQNQKYLNAVSYVDNALELLISKAPQSSVFFMYSDHSRSHLSPEATLFWFYDKRQVRGLSGNIDNFNRVTAIINGFVEQNRK